MYTANISQNISCQKKVRGRSFLAWKALSLCWWTKRWQLLLANGKRPCFKCLLDCILLTKNFIQLCAVQQVCSIICLSCYGTRIFNVLNWTKGDQTFQPLKPPNLVHKKPWDLGLKPFYKNDENTRNLLESSEHRLYAWLNAGCMCT